MNRFLIAGAISLACAANAYAADISTPPPAPAPMYTKAPPPTYSWTGFYLGLNAGYGWGDNSTSFTGDPFFFGPLIAGGYVPASPATNAGGFVGGGQVGYNWQSGPLVYGIEADIQYADISGTASAAAGAPPLVPFFNTTVQNKVDWFGTLRPRLGFTVTPNFLVYATGGLAYGEVASSASTVITGPAPNSCAFSLCTAGAASQTRAGWTAGAGVEYALASPWSLKVEYLYVDLGHENYNMPANFIPTIAYMQATSVFHENIVRAGVNYKFW